MVIQKWKWRKAEFLKDISSCLLFIILSQIEFFLFFFFFSTACSALGVTQLDSVIIAPPPIEDGINLSLEYLQPYWGELENLVQHKKIVAIGTSDLDKTLLEQLYLWSQVRTDYSTIVTLRHGFYCCFLGMPHIQLNNRKMTFILKLKYWLR